MAAQAASEIASSIAPGASSLPRVRHFPVIA
jgi:hypothetical protein